MSVNFILSTLVDVNSWNFWQNVLITHCAVKDTSEILLYANLA